MLSSGARQTAKKDRGGRATDTPRDDPGSADPGGVKREPKATNARNLPAYRDPREKEESDSEMPSEVRGTKRIGDMISNLNATLLRGVEDRAFEECSTLIRDLAECYNQNAGEAKRASEAHLWLDSLE